MSGQIISLWPPWIQEFEKEAGYMSSEERLEIAQELAAKGGQQWEGLNEEMVNAYLHNADLVIEDRDRPPVDEVTGKVVYTCDRCQDKAYIGGTQCAECNPVGLPAEEVHPHAVAVVGKLVEVDRLTHLCDTCKNERPVCYADIVEYGDGVGNDNVIKCDTFEVDDEIAAKAEAEALAKKEAGEKAEADKATRVLKANEYRCSKCSKPGKTIIHILQKSGTGIGHKHREFAAKK